MGVLKNKIDFVMLISVSMANCNGDPLNGNRPRTDYNGFGEISDVCIKRKIRNRMQDLGENIFVQSPEHDNFDGCGSLKERADKFLGKPENKKGKKKEENTGSAADAYTEKACQLFTDVRTFGQVFALGKDEGDASGVSVPVRGPVSIHQAVSCTPVEIESMQITKCVNGAPSEGRSSDTMGMKHFVRHGIYMVKGAVNVQLAEKTGYTEEDAALLKECLRTLFVNDASSARPDGSMEVAKLYWFAHNCKDGQYSSAKVHRSIHVVPTDPKVIPSSIDDYTITLDSLPGLTVEVIEGV